MFDDLSSVTMKVTLDSLSKRSRVTADNIANVNTPHFLAGRVSFEDALADAITNGDPTEPSVHMARSLEPTREDGNNVNLDHETLTAWDTGLRYSLMLRGVDDKFGLLSTVIKGGVA
ncbi:MAG: flagellar biosynthesis protein FlgB [Micromonosporaceae bacterium]|nr:flagellar biosynthesis protein FlgB [Micromonosporaceae bacterium]